MNMLQKNYVKERKGKFRVKVNVRGKSYRASFTEEVAALRYATGICLKNNLPVSRIPVM